jgi:hypothetical protein
MYRDIPGIMEYFMDVLSKLSDAGGLVSFSVATYGNSQEEELITKKKTHTLTNYKTETSRPPPMQAHQFCAVACSTTLKRTFL